MIYAHYNNNYYIIHLMNYKNSITYNLQNIRDKETLLNLLIKLSKRLDNHKQQILMKNFEKRKERLNANFEKLFEDTTNNLIENNLF